MVKISELELVDLLCQHARVEDHLGDLRYQIVLVEDIDLDDLKRRKKKVEEALQQLKEEIAKKVGGKVEDFTIEGDEITFNFGMD